MSGELVTCVIPVRDGGQYLGKAITSALAQTHSAIEVVVIDDGSVDASAEVARGFGESVRFVTHEHPRGAPATRSHGVGIAHGDLVAFLDADDLWQPDRIERQLAHLRAHRLAISFCEVANFWEDGFEHEAERWHAAGRVRGTYLFITALARRGVFARTPIPLHLPHMDSAAWILALREADVPIGLLPEVLVHRRRHATNISRNATAVYDDVFEILKARLDRRRTSPEEPLQTLPRRTRASAASPTSSAGQSTAWGLAQPRTV
jgi:glycosyltransferase involved in cell wall biosynthesis